MDFVFSLRFCIDSDSTRNQSATSYLQMGDGHGMNDFVYQGLLWCVLWFGPKHVLVPC